MGKTFGGLFGSPSRQQSTTPTGFQSLPGFGREAFEDVIRRGTALSQQPELFAPPDLTAQQQAALGTLEAGLQPISAEQFQTGLATFQDPFEQQVVQSALQDLRETGRGFLSDIGQGASAAGGFGGTRQAVLESELGRNLAREAGGLSGRLRSQGFQQASQRTLENLIRPQQVAQALFPLAETARGIQFGQQQAPLAAVDFLSNLAQGLPTGGGTRSTARGEDPGAISRIATGLGNIGTIGASLGGFFSDKRLKENIKKVDKQHGFNIYEFNYKDRPEDRYRGVLAQEVKETRPDAVYELEGYLVVDYERIGLRMEAA